MRYKLDAVLNLSSKTFTRDELRILSLGFNFRPSLPAFPTQDYILATEAHIKSANLSSEDSALLRNAVVNELERIHKKLAYKPPRSNFLPRDWALIKALKADDSIIIIPADKGNKTIILDKLDYLKKLEQRILTHRKIDSDPTPQREHKLNSTLKSIQHSSPPYYQKPSPPDPDLILPRSCLIKRNKATFSSSAWLHGILKAHKPHEDFPLREISDSSNCPGHCQNPPSTIRPLHRAIKHIPQKWV